MSAAGSPAASAPASDARRGAQPARPLRPSLYTAYGGAGEAARGEAGRVSIGRRGTWRRPQTLDRPRGTGLERICPAVAGFTPAVADLAGSRGMCAVAARSARRPRVAVEAQLGELRPARVGLALVRVLRIGVEVGPTLRAQP